jgi:hypothetical protein
VKRAEIAVLFHMAYYLCELLEASRRNVLEAAEQTKTGKITLKQGETLIDKLPCSSVSLTHIFANFYL